MNWLRRLAWGLGRLLVLVVALAAVAVIGGAWYVDAMSRDRVASVKAVPDVPVAVVLGAEADASGRPSAYLRARLDLASQLYSLGKVKVILVSGNNDAASHHETDVMRAYLVGRGIPAARIVADPAGVDTYSTCARAKQVFAVNRSILVSQSYHLPRALATCRALGLDAWGVGDATVKADGQTWFLGTAREYAANLMMFYDVISKRELSPGPKDDSLTQALKASVG